MHNCTGTNSLPPPDNGSGEGKETEKYPVVAIGASAGGLEAFELFFRNLPPAVNASFVLIQHLGKEQPSMLRDLVSRFTRLPVHNVTEGMRVEVNHVYVIPSGVNMALDDGVLRLTERVARPRVPMPIDFFFRSLARERTDGAIAILLSGTGTDGSLGLRDIHGAGGVTMVQDPHDARFPGMPEAAINTSDIDYVLPASKMGEQLAQIVDRLHLAQPPRPEPPAQLENVLDRIFTLVRLRTHHDFSHYRRNTLTRRIERRMLLHAVADPQGYVAYLEKNPDEALLLFNEFLIRVTSFFRDPGAFDTLKADILPRLLADKPDNEVIRVWVPGCSTGEEAYSLTMVLHEYLEERKKGNEVQVFASDIDTRAIDVARAGVYPQNIAADVSEDRLRRFFTREEDRYKVKKELRERVVFAIHDLTKDPPFTRLDLLSCRNVLIYMDATLQGRIIPLFHYSLRPGGALFLGPSEGIGPFSDIFGVTDRKWKIFEARGNAVYKPALPEHFFSAPAYDRKKEQAESKASTATVADSVRQRLLRSYTPPAVVVDENGTIAFIQGETGKFLQPAEGAPHLNLFGMAREGMRAEVHMAVAAVKEKKTEVTYRDLPVRTDSGIVRIDLKVAPLAEPGTDGLFLVVFDEAKAQDERGAKKKAGKTSYDVTFVERLQEELHLTKAHLQSTVEELQSSNEELRSANEELQSTNEEVQSTNEELETSREELQSVNEELVTVNAELQSKIEQLSRTEVDLKNLLEAIKVATIFCDTSLHIVRFTNEARKLVNLMPSDVGRPLADITTKFGYGQMIDDAKSVLATLQSRETDVVVESGEWHHLRILPQKNQENVVVGIVITFIDVTSSKQLTAAEVARDDALAVVDTVREPLVVLDGDLRVISANRSFYRTFKVEKEETEGEFVYDLGNKQWDIPDLRRLLEELLPAHGKFQDFRVEHAFPFIGRRVMLLNAREIARGKGADLILLAIEDMTAEAGREGVQ